MLNKKINRMQKIEKYEQAILKLKKWKPGEKIDLKEEYDVGEVCNETQIKNLIDLFECMLESVKNTRISNDKLYLSEIINKEKPKFGSNNLILAPVGSGKSSLIKNVLVKKTKGEILFLVSNTSLKDSICPKTSKERKNIGHRMFTTQNKQKFGDENYEIHVMTYAELGYLIKSNDTFIDKFSQIYCDEIHSLPDYQTFNNSVELSHAIKYLFNKHEGKQIFYFTATRANLDNLQKRQPEIMNDVKIFDYLNHPHIRKYVALSEYKINHIEQIRPHLKARLESFNYFKYKGLAFSRTIAGQKRIERIAIEEGFKPLSLWSVNNKDEDKQMTKEQCELRDKLLITGKIPEPYNLLIINSAMQEGWDLKDESVKLAIMNTTNETEKIQALGRLRGDVDLLIYKAKKNTNLTNKNEIDCVPDKYINVYLNSDLKEELCKNLNLRDSQNRLCKWTTIKKLLSSKGYVIKDKKLTKDGKQQRVSVITLKQMKERLT